GEVLAGGLRLPLLHLAAVELLRDLVHLDQPLPAAHLFAVGTPGALLVPQLHTGPLRHALDGLDERDAVQLLEEREDVPRFAAAEAVVHAHLRADVEGGVRSSWNGHSPLSEPTPAVRRVTNSPTTSSRR